jgi:hypothetical protein
MVSAMSPAPPLHRQTPLLRCHLPPCRRRRLSSWSAACATGSIASTGRKARRRVRSTFGPRELVSTAGHRALRQASWLGRALAAAGAGNGSAGGSAAGESAAARPGPALASSPRSCSGRLPFLAVECLRNPRPSGHAPNQKPRPFSGDTPQCHMTGDPTFGDRNPVAKMALGSGFFCRFQGLRDAAVGSLSGAALPDGSPSAAR